MPKRFAGVGLNAREICEKIGWDPGRLSDLRHGKGGC
jgi:hypothetical protein